MKKLRKAIVPALLIIGVWFTILLVHSGALAMNNFARNEGMVSLPPVTSWFLFAARYHIIVIAGVVLSLLAILAAVRKSHALHNALSLGLVGALVFVALGLAVFVISIGMCLCDEWKQWEEPDRPTSASTATNQPAEVLKAAPEE